MTSNLIEIIKQYDNLTDADKEIFKKVINSVSYIHIKVGDKTTDNTEADKVDELKKVFERIIKEQKPDRIEPRRYPFDKKSYPFVSPIIDPLKPSPNTNPYTIPTIWYQTFDNN